MKKRLILLLASAMLAISFAAPTVVSGEVFKKNCADIVAGSGQTSDTDTDGQYDFTFGMQTAAPCGGVVFTMYVYDDEGQCSTLPLGEIGTPTATLTVRGADRTTEAFGQVVFSAPEGVDDDGTVWVFATSSQGNALYDRAPDTGCTDYGDAPFGKPFG